MLNGVGWFPWQFFLVDTSRHHPHDIGITSVARFHIADNIPFLKGFEQHADIPDKAGERPSIHFASHTGWLNDPNGLLYDGECYHLYFQHNPFGTQWFLFFCGSS